MKAPLYNEVHILATAIANASAAEDFDAAEELYNVLWDLCLDNENKPSNHPLQWEALGDFSSETDKAIDAYQKGLAAAKAIALPEYEASLLFAMAELNAEESQLEVARKLIQQALTIEHRNAKLAKKIVKFAKQLGG